MKKSSSIADVSHDPANGVLSVKFHSGATYHYEGVSAAQAAAFKGADSVGRHFMANIKGSFKQVQR
jgi:hypothetical protein